MVAEIRTQGIKRLNAKFKRISVNVRNKYSLAVLEDAYKFTLKIMPRDTGRLRKALQLIKRKQSGQIRQNLPIQSRRNPRPYHLWLNGIGNPSYLRSDGTAGRINVRAFQARIRSGRINYMALTAEYIRKNARKKFKEITKL